MHLKQKHLNVYSRLQENLLSQQGITVCDGLLCDNEALLVVTAMTMVLQQPGVAKHQLQSGNLIHHAAPTVLCVMHHLQSGKANVDGICSSQGFAIATQADVIIDALKVFEPANRHAYPNVTSPSAF